MTERYDSHAAWEIIDSDYSLFEVALIAEQFHADVDYHNFEHPLDTLLYAHKEIETYEANENVQLPRLKIYKALLLHDIAVHVPLDTSQFPTAEHRSAHYAGYILRELGDSEEDIADIQRWIINTNVNYPCDDDLAKIVCRSDIGNTADRLPVFFVNFIKVYRETQKAKLKQRKIKAFVDPFQAAEESIAFLNKYFRQDLTLGTGDWDKTPDGVCRFVARATKNFLQLPEQIKNSWIDDKAS